MERQISDFSSGDTGSNGGLRRFWRFPFIAGWLATVLLFKSRAEQVDANAVAATHVAVVLHDRSMFEHIDYIRQSEHESLVWFGAGIAVFVVCYFASAFLTAGIRAPWRLLPIDDEDVSDEASWSARVVASIGAAVCAACIAVSYGIHWLE
jgi:hypothetical protein